MWDYFRVKEMFWKRLFGRLSIKARLGFFFMLGALLMSSSSYLLVHRTLHTSLSKEENDFIFDRLHTVRAIIQTRPEFLDIIRKEIEWEGKYSPYPAYYLRITDQAGRLLLETPGMGNRVPRHWASPLAANHRSFHDDEVRKADNDRFFLLKSDIVENPASGATSLKVQIALDVTSEVLIDEANHDKVISMLVLGCLLFVIVGLLIIHRVLRPLGVMIDVAEQISVDALSQRTDPLAWPTEVRRLADAFNTMLDRLGESLGRLSSCASNMAHEIRTPINNIMGEAEIALLDERTPREYQKVLESSMEECARLSRLVDNLLFLSHAENPAHCIQRIKFDPIDGIAAVFSQLRQRAHEKHAKLSVHGCGLLAGDPLLFQRAVGNLVMNALSYSPDGVKVDVTVRETTDGYVEVIVSDTGYGINDAEFSRIFDRFYRGDSSHSNYPEGSGLGLSIVKATMDLHGGAVEVKSRSGEGTEFTLRFPRKPPVA